MHKKYLLITIVAILSLPILVFAINATLNFTTKHAAEALEGLVPVPGAEIEVFQERLEELFVSVFPSLVPPVISNIQIQNITENSAIIVWETNVPANSLVAFASARDFNLRKENPYLLELGRAEGRTREHRVELIGLHPGTIYHFQIRSASMLGVIGRSRDVTFSTLAGRIALEVPKIGNTEIEVRWVSPRETTSFVEYRNLRTGEVSRTGSPVRTRSHIITLTNLAPDTPYDIRGFGYDVDNILIESSPVNVRTRLDNIPPRVSAIRIDNALLPGRVDRALTVVSWRTDELANSLVYFEEGVGVGDVLVNQIGQGGNFVLDHTVIIPTKAGTVYRLQIVSMDQAGNLTRVPARTILTPRAEESIFDVIIENFQRTFEFLRR